MNAKKRKRIRILGKILFVLYVIFIIYFLIFSDWYGRTGEMQEYHYNLELFKEIRRFWEYRDQVGMFDVHKSVRECGDFRAVWFFYADGKQI